MKKFPLKRILAIAGLVLIAGLYAATIICALIDSPFARSCLIASLFCTIVVPVVIYAFLMITKQISGNTPGQAKEEAQPDTEKNRKKAKEESRRDTKKSGKANPKQGKRKTK